MRALLALLLLVPLVAGCAAPPGGPAGTAAASQSAPATSATQPASAVSTTPPPAAPAADPCALDRTTLTLSDPDHTVVLIRTSLGCMAAELYDDKAPKTVANFRAYVEEGFYTDLQCYRIVSRFVNQCGGERDGKTGEKPAIENEARASGLHNDKYTLAMARLGATCQTCPDQPDTATTEFYINAADNCFLDPKSTSRCPQQASTEAGYAVFGILVAGREVSDQINRQAGRSIPLESITLLA